MPVDALGNRRSGSPEAVAHLDDAVDRWLRHDGGVAEAARAATLADPSFGLAHAVRALTDPSADPAALLATASSLADRGTDVERSLTRVLGLLVTGGLWAAEQAALEHARAHPRDLLGVGLAGTIVERSTRPDVAEAVLAVYAPSRRALGDHPYLLCMVGFVVQEQGRFAEAGEMASRALAQQPTSVTAAHLLAHVRLETADHASGLAWLDGFRASMDPRGDYVHHLGWHAALHALALDRGRDVLDRLAALSRPDGDDVRNVVDTGTLLARCRLCGLLGPHDDPTDGRAGAVPPGWLQEDLPSMYLAFHVAVGLVVSHREDDLRALAVRARRMGTPGLAELLAPLAEALADYVGGRHAAAAASLDALRPTAYRWGGSRAQRDVVEDVLVDAAVRGGRPDIARRVLLERTQRRPNIWDEAALRRLHGPRVWHP